MRIEISIFRNNLDKINDIINKEMFRLRYKEKTKDGRDT